MADTCHKPDLLFLVATSLDAEAVRANFAGMLRATQMLGYAYIPTVYNEYAPPTSSI